MYLVARYLPWIVQLYVYIILALYHAFECPHRALLAINVNGTTGLTFTFDQCAAWQVVQGILLQVIVTTVDVILVIRGEFPNIVHYAPKNAYLDHAESLRAI